MAELGLVNHDRKRIATRVGAAQARTAAVLLLTLRGTPTLYYGDELGLTDVAVPPEREQDPWGVNVPPGTGATVRTPMQWDAGPNAGFSAGEPWLPLGDDADVRNVAVQREDPDSMLALHRDLLSLRRAEPALRAGDHRTVAAEGDVLAYERSHGDRRCSSRSTSGRPRRGAARRHERDRGAGQRARPRRPAHRRRRRTLAPGEAIVGAIPGPDTI